VSHKKLESLRLDKTDKKLRFLLIGIYGTFNYGCEAIVRGTVRLLRERWPNCHITLASAFPAEDAERLSDIKSLKVVQAHQRWTMKRIILGIARRLGIGKGSPLPLKRSLISQYDVVLSIGGDNYSFMSSDNRLHHYTKDLIKFGEHTLRKGKKYVLWGASVGPFDNVPSVRDYFTKHLKKLSLITAREEVTGDYLRKLGCRNMVLVADPAFVMEPAKDVEPLPKGADDILFAINLSPASLRSLLLTDKIHFEKCKHLLIESIRKLLENRRLHILLVPHVTPLSETDNDDYAFLLELYNQLGKFHNRISLLERGLGATKTKAILSQCDAAIAARMHCCIAALSSGVPTVLLQYSTKALGMARFVYGDEEWCLHIADINQDSLYDKVNKLLKNRAKLSAHLIEKKPAWEADARKATEALANVI
jgi:colanic acid/amylovoran biosynthesis protein